jgi:hypothetical protein
MITSIFVGYVTRWYVIMNYESAIIVHLINVKIVRQNIGKTLINLIHSDVQNVLKYVIANNENY